MPNEATEYSEILRSKLANLKCIRWKQLNSNYNSSELLKWLN